MAAVTLLFCFPKSFRVQYWKIALTAVAYAATLALFVIANKLTTSANAIFLQSTSPFYLLLLSPLLLHEPIRRFHAVGISAVACGGILLLLGFENAISTAPDPVRGNIVAGISGATWALTIAGFRSLARYDKHPNSALSAVILGNFTVLTGCLASAPFASIHLRDGVILLYLGIFQVGLAYIALTRSVRRVSALEAGVFLLIEPVFNSVWSWLLHNERPSALARAGGLVIIVTAFSATLWEARREIPT